MPSMQGGHGVRCELPICVRKAALSTERMRSRRTFHLESPQGSAVTVRQPVCGHHFVPACESTEHDSLHPGNRPQALDPNIQPYVIGLTIGNDTLSKTGSNQAPDEAGPYVFTLGDLAATLHVHRPNLCLRQCHPATERSYPPLGGATGNYQTGNEKYPARHLTCIPILIYRDDKPINANSNTSSGWSGPIKVKPGRQQHHFWILITLLPFLELSRGADLTDIRRSPLQKRQT